MVAPRNIKGFSITTPSPMEPVLSEVEGGEGCLSAGSVAKGEEKKSDAIHPPLSPLPSRERRVGFPSPGIFRLAQAQVPNVNGNGDEESKIREEIDKVVIPALKNKGIEISSGWKKDFHPAIALFVQLGKLSGGKRSWTFGFGLKALLDLGLIRDIGDLDASQPNSIGANLLRLASIAGENTATLIQNVFSILVKEGVLTEEELRKNFRVTEGSWLESLGGMAKEGSQAVWTFFHFGLPFLIKRGLVRKDHLDEDLRYVKGSLTYEIARLNNTIQGGWDYFEELFPDCIRFLGKIDSETVAEFVRQTIGPAKTFYEAEGDDPNNKMRWRTKIRPFIDFLPLEDIPTLLTLVGQTRNRPQGQALTRWIEQKRDWRLLQPRDESDLKRMEQYSSFLMTLTQKGEEQTAYLNRLDLSLLTQNFKNRSPKEIVRVAELLNIMMPSQDRNDALGDRWIKKSHFQVFDFSGVVAVNPDNLDEVYAKYFIVSRSNPKTLESMHFTWSNGMHHKISLADLGRMILTAHRLQALFGDQNPLADFLKAVDFKNVSFDLQDVPKEFFDVQGLEKVRTEINEYTGNVGGDAFVALLSQAITTAPIEAIGLESLIAAMQGWSQWEKLQGSYLYQDLKGRYDLFSRHAATRLRDYFEVHPEELLKRPDRVSIENVLEKLERPLRKIPELPKEIAAKMSISIKSPSQRISPPLGGSGHGENPFMTWLSEAENSGPSLSDPRLSNIRLDQPTTVETLRKEIAQNAGQERADQFVHQLYTRYFRDPVSLDNVETVYNIAFGTLNYSDSFYSVWGNFAASQFGKFLGTFDEGDFGKIPAIDQKIAWLQSKGLLDEKVSAMHKLWREAKQGHFVYILSKARREAVKKFSSGGEAEVDDNLKNPLKYVALKGALPGYSVENIIIDGRHRATLVKGNPTKGARVVLQMKPGAGVSQANNEKAFGNILQYQGPVLMVSGQNKGIQVMVDKGVIENWVFDPSRLHGYLIAYPDGAMNIVDSRRLKLSDLTRKKEDASVRLDLNDPMDFRRAFETASEKKLSILASMYFENRAGANYTKNPTGPDSRRILVQFDDGQFGMLDSAENMSVNDLLHIAWQIGAAKALFCDTGMFDRASYYLYEKGSRERVMVGLGDEDRPSNVVIFKQGE